jgi:hypothetical protein
MLEQSRFVFLNLLGVLYEDDKDKRSINVNFTSDPRFC